MRNQIKFFLIGSTVNTYILLSLEQNIWKIIDYWNTKTKNTKQFPFRFNLDSLNLNGNTHSILRRYLEDGFFRYLSRKNVWNFFPSFWSYSSKGSTKKISRGESIDRFKNHEYKCEGRRFPCCINESKQSYVLHE